MKKALFQFKGIIIKMFSEYHRLKYNDSKQRIILLDMPTHSNIGDHTIAMAEREFIVKELDISEKDIFEFTRNEWSYLKGLLISTIRENDIIILPGGGYMGSLWPDEEDTVIDILSSFKENPIIIFPQTIYFEESEYGKKREKELLDVIKMCNDLVIFARDRMTYELLNDNAYYQVEKVFLVPDIVTYLMPRMPVKQKKEILLVMRNDLEKSVKELELVKTCKENFPDYEIKEISMHHCKNISSKIRKDIITEKWKEYAEASLVITDRLHGMLFATINATPCIAFDNCSHKVSGQYEWIKGFDFVCQTSESEFSIEMIERLMNFEAGEYSNLIFNECYKVIKNQMQLRIIK